MGSYNILQQDHYLNFDLNLLIFTISKGSDYKFLTKSHKHFVDPGPAVLNQNKLLLYQYYRYTQFNTDIITMPPLVELKLFFTIYARY